MIGDALVDGADEMRAAAVGQLETEFAAAVGSRFPGFFHAVGKTEQDDLIAGGGFASGAIGDGAGEGLSGGRRCQRKQQEDSEGGHLPARCSRYMGLCEFLQGLSYGMCSAPKGELRIGVMRHR